MTPWLTLPLAAITLGLAAYSLHVRRQRSSWLRDALDCEKELDMVRKQRDAAYAEVERLRGRERAMTQVFGASARSEGRVN